MAENMVLAMAMVGLQIGFSGMYIFSKLALEDGMSPLVLIAYRQIFAVLVMILLAAYFERTTIMQMTKKVYLQLLLCSVFGITACHCFYNIGLQYSSPTVTCAIENLKPAITFLMALLFKMEKLRLKHLPGQAKVLGTIVCVGGAMLTSFYKGVAINILKSNIHWEYAVEMIARNGSRGGFTNFLGPLFVALSGICSAIWAILQTELSKDFVAPYTTTAVMVAMASIQCLLIAITQERTIEAWSLTSRIRLVAVLYNAALGSAISFVVMSWCISKRGPLYVCIFGPLLLIVAAVLGWALLGEKLYVGSVVGWALIMTGLYAVLWGMSKDPPTNEGESSGDKGGGDADTLEMEGNL